MDTFDPSNEYKEGFAKGKSFAEGGRGWQSPPWKITHYRILHRWYRQGMTDAWLKGFADAYFPEWGLPVPSDLHAMPNLPEGE